LWNRLANYSISSGDFIEARKTFKQGISVIRSIKDFALIYNAY